MSAESVESRSRARSRSRRNIGALVAKGLAVAIPMFGLFAAHAFLSEATYETSAKLTLAPAPNSESKLPAPLVTLRELQNAAMDEQTLERLASDKVGAEATAEEREEEAHRIRKAFVIDTKDGLSYSLTFRDTDPKRAQTVCNLLASRALAHASRGLGLEQRNSPPPPSERQKRMTELLAFLSQHPEVARTVPGIPATPGVDPVLAALLNERAQIEAALQRLPARPSDNPYAEPPAPIADRATLERRLADINGAIGNRKKAEERESVKPKVDPAIEAQLLTLLRAVQQAPEEAPAPAPAPRFTAKLTKASVPDSPVKPDRPRVLLIGALVGLASGIIFVVGRAKVAVPRRSRSSGAPSVRRQRSDARADSPPATERLPNLPLATPAGVMPDIPTAPPLPQVFFTPALLPQGAPANPWAVTLPAAPAPQVPEREAEADMRWNSAGLERSETQPTRARSTPPPPALDEGESSRPIVDVEAVAIDSEGTGANAGGMHGEMKRPNRKVTQILGSPPSIPGNRQSARPSDGGTAPLPNTGYSYVNASARAEPVARHSQPHATPPEAVNVHAPLPDAGAPNGPSAASPNARGPAAAPSRPPPAPGGARVLITPLPPPIGWRPEATLDPGSRQALAQEVMPAGTRGCFVVGVTGPSSDLKGRVASELSLALAHHRRVLLLEADFQRPTLHQWMRIEMSLATGYSHQLRARVYEEHGDGRLRVVECGPTLHVLAEGMMRAPGMILSREFEDSVMSLRAFYDFIVVNGPPSTAEIDLHALAGVVDGVVMCGQRAPVPLVFRAKRLFAPVES